MCRLGFYTKDLFDQDSYTRKGTGKVGATNTVTFSDYGEPVRVRMPPASKVIQS